VPCEITQNIEWQISSELIPYQFAVDFMEARVQAIHEGTANEMVWLLQHPPIFTIGTSGNHSDILGAGDIEIAKTGRGGQVTYHGPGQRVIYLMLDLKRRSRDVRKFVCNVEKWVIASLADLGVVGNIRDGRIGVWVDVPQENGAIREEKIAAIGLRIRRWVSFHGVSINVAPDLEHFARINPCGMSKDDYGVTSLEKLAKSSSINALDDALKANFHTFLGT